MHSHRYNYNLPTRHRSATATPEIDLDEQLEGLQRTLDGQRALLEILNEAHIFVGQQMNPEFLADLTQDLLPVAAFLNETAQRELAHFWEAFRRCEAQRTPPQKEPSPLSHDASRDQSYTLGGSNAEQEVPHVSQSQTA